MVREGINQAKSFIIYQHCLADSSSPPPRTARGGIHKQILTWRYWGQNTKRFRKKGLEIRFRKKKHLEIKFPRKQPRD
jgi:hypothetical protein